MDRDRPRRRLPLRRARGADVTVHLRTGLTIALSYVVLLAIVALGVPLALNLRDRATHWVCGKTTVDAAQLARYPVDIRTIGQTDAVIVDLFLPPTSSSTTTTTTTS